MSGAMSEVGPSLPNQSTSPMSGVGAEPDTAARRSIQGGRASRSSPSISAALARAIASPAASRGSRIATEAELPGERGNNPSPFLQHVRVAALALLQSPQLALPGGQRPRSAVRRVQGRPVATRSACGVSSGDRTSLGRAPGRVAGWGARPGRLATPDRPLPLRSWPIAGRSPSCCAACGPVCQPSLPLPEGSKNMRPAVFCVSVFARRARRSGASARP